MRAWRARFAEQRLADFGSVAPGRGRRSWLPEGTVAAVVEETLHARPDDGSTHWTTRSMAARHGIGKDTVARIWRDHKLKPWQTKRFKVSGDPRFEEELVDVVGLYLNPPERAAVFSFDEKTQCQALDRTQPSVPLRPGRAGTMTTHDYKRHGTTDLFAALNIATGEILTDCRKQHAGADVLRFFMLIDLHVPRHLDVDVVLDNLSAHSAPEVQKWLAHPKRSRWHLHFIPTSSSWLNLVERWFKELTDRRLRRGAFTSVPALVDAIETWVERWNDDPKPFVWHKEAEGIHRQGPPRTGCPYPSQIRHAGLVPAARRRGDGRARRPLDDAPVVRAPAGGPGDEPERDQQRRDPTSHHSPPHSVP